jgi:hypothetical protein
MEHIMNMPTDREQADIQRWQDQQQKARQQDEDGPTTQKINKRLSESEQRTLHQIAEVWNAVIDNKQKVDDHDGFISKIKRNFLGIVKG